MNINLDKRQKIILVILILLVAFLLWQIFGLKSSGSKAKNLTPVKPVATLTKTAASSEAMTPPSPPIVRAPIAPQPQLIPPQQAEYLQTVDQYQLAQIKRMLAEQIAATAAADASAAKSKAETNKLIGASSANNSITTFIPSGQQLEPSLQPIQNTMMIDASKSGGGYQVSFIGNKEGRWSAILARNGEYTIATVGTVLGDQSVVTEINSNGVSIKNGEMTTFIPFQTNLVG